MTCTITKNQTHGEIKKIAKEQNMEEKDVLKLLDVSPIAARRVLNGADINFYIKIYSPAELQEIKQKVESELSQFPRINGDMIKLVKQRYRLGAKDMRDILNANYIKYKTAENQNKYLNINWDKDEDKPEEKKITINKYTVSKKDIEQIAKQENVSLEEAGERIGLKKERLKNLISGKQLKAKVVDDDIKYKVEKLKLDLKYIEGKGERHYKPEELALMSIIYEIPIKDIIFYLANSESMNKVYQEALANNPDGVWIGGKTRLSNDVIEENYRTLNCLITKIAKKVCYIYGANYEDEQDFKAEAFEYLLRNGGIYEKNLGHNQKMLNIALISNVQNIMQNYYKKLPRELSLTLEYEGKEYDNPEALADERYNPEKLMLEDSSYLKEISEEHSNIVRDIDANSFFAMDFPKKCFSKIAQKYKMTDELFEDTMLEIRTFIIKSGLVKFDKHGRIISMFGVEE